MYLNFNVSPICFFKHVDNLIKSNLFLSAIERLPLSLICKARFFVCRNYVKAPPLFRTILRPLILFTATKPRPLPITAGL